MSWFDEHKQCLADLVPSVSADDKKKYAYLNCPFCNNMMRCRKYTSIGGEISSEVSMCCFSCDIDFEFSQQEDGWFLESIWYYYSGDQYVLMQFDTSHKSCALTFYPGCVSMDMMTPEGCRAYTQKLRMLQ
jgi:hypothetical protein